MPGALCCTAAHDKGSRPEAPSLQLLQQQDCFIKHMKALALYQARQHSLLAAPRDHHSPDHTSPLFGSKDQGKCNCESNATHPQGRRPSPGHWDSWLGRSCRVQRCPPPFTGHRPETQSPKRYCSCRHLKEPHSPWGSLKQAWRHPPSRSLHPLAGRSFLKILQGIPPWSHPCQLSVSL